MTNEEIKNNWAKMSKQFELDVHASMGWNSNDAENLRSMTLRSPLLNFKIMQSNSLLILSGDYGTYVFRDIHDIFTIKGSDYFLANGYEMLHGNLMSADVNYSSFSIDFIKSLATFKYSCEAIKLAVKKYQGMGR